VVVVVVVHIFIVGEHVRVDHSKSYPMDNKLSLKGAWSRHMTHFKFLVPKISLEQLKLDTSNFVHSLALD